MQAQPFHERLREILADVGMSQEELTERIHADRSNVSRWVNGKTNPSNTSIKRIADATGCNFEWLSSGAGEKFPTSSGQLKNAGQRLRLVRDGLDKTVEEFAASLGLPTGELEDIENGRAGIAGPLVKLLRLLYGVSEEWLLAGKEETFAKEWMTGARASDRKLPDPPPTCAALRDLCGRLPAAERERFLEWAKEQAAFPYADQAARYGEHTEERAYFIWDKGFLEEGLENSLYDRRQHGEAIEDYMRGNRSDAELYQTAREAAKKMVAMIKKVVG